MNHPGTAACESGPHDNKELSSLATTSKITVGPRVLYLANYAPLLGSETPPSDHLAGSCPEYHREVFTTLEDMGLQVIPSREVTTLMIEEANSIMCFHF